MILETLYNFSINLISHFISFNYLNKTEFKIILPFYHTVSDKYLPHISNLYKYKNIAKFNSDLDFILKHFEPITIDDFVKIKTENKKINKNYFLLSFDDGLSEIYNVIYPILKNKNIPAIFFINSSFVDNTNLFHRYKVSLIIENLKNSKNNKLNIKKLLIDKNLYFKNISSSLLKLNFSNIKLIDEIAEKLNINFNIFLQKNKPYLSVNQLKHLREENFYLGSHSENHPEFYIISEENQILQTKNSTNFIKEKFEQKYSFFAFPFSDYGVKKTYFQKIFAENIIDLTFGTAGIKIDCIKKNIQRIPMDKNQSAKKILKKELLKTKIRTLFNKNIIKR